MFPQFLSRGYICRRKQRRLKLDDYKEKRSRESPRIPTRWKCAVIFGIIGNEYIGRRLIYLLRVYIKYCFVTAERARLSNQGGVNDRDQFVFCRKTLSRGDRVGIFVPAALHSLRSTCACAAAATNAQTAMLHLILKTFARNGIWILRQEKKLFILKYFTHKNII